MVSLMWINMIVEHPPLPEYSVALFNLFHLSGSLFLHFSWVCSFFKTQEQCLPTGFRDPQGTWLGFMTQLKLYARYDAYIYIFMRMQFIASFGLSKFYITHHSPSTQKVKNYRNRKYFCVMYYNKLHCFMQPLNSEVVFNRN